MKLFLLSGSEGGQPVLDVRFGDAPDPAAGVPVDLTLFTDAAHERIRERYPSFIYEFARTSGLLDILGWRGIVAAYWFMPFSERSPMRTRLIEDLYRLTLLSLVVEKHRPRELQVTTAEDKLWRAIERYATAHGMTALRSRLSRAVMSNVMSAARWSRLARALEVVVRGCRLCAGAWRIAKTRARLLAEAWSKRRLFRDQASEVMATRERKFGNVVAFYTRYPVLWEIANGRPSRERNFGTFPDYLTRQGFGVVYPGVFSSGVSELRTTLSAVRAEACERGIVFLDALLSVGELLRVCLAVGHVVRYLLWRGRLGRRPIRFEDMDVRELVLRELDTEFLYGTELLANYARAYALRRFCRRYRPRVIFHPFEYQPMERALYAGADAGSAETVVVGVQTGMFSSNRLAWFYAEGEVEMPGVIPARHRSPFPDYLAVYGTLGYATLSRQCPPDRLLLAGAIRYPEIQREVKAPRSQLRDLDSPSQIRILVAGTANKDETVRLLRASAVLSRARPEIFLLIKFHHHNALQSEWTWLAAESGCASFRVCDTRLVTLLEQSRAVVLGWSSTGVVVEAISAGCMPVVLQPPDRYGYGTSVDVRDAIFVCDDEVALGEAVNDCVDQTPAYWERRRAWPEALEKMAFRLDGRQDERLLAQLRERRVL